MGNVYQNLFIILLLLSAAVGALALAQRFRLPAMLAYQLIRWRNVLLQMFFFNIARLRPEKFSDRLLGMVRQEVGAEAVAKHFTPSYRPWQQRLCLVPDSDFFEALKAGKTSIVTDTIESFTEDGILLPKSKAELRDRGRFAVTQ